MSNSNVSLRTDYPESLKTEPVLPDPMPVAYTPEWLAARAAVDQWEQERARAVLLVHLNMVEDTFTPGIWGDPEPSHCVAVVPEYGLRRWRDDIEEGRAAWMYLTDAVKLLSNGAAADDGAAAMLRVQMREMRSQSAAVAQHLRGVEQQLGGIRALLVNLG